MNIKQSAQTARDIVRKGYVRRLQPDATGGYVASILEFPGCIAEGDTAEEAMANLDRAAEAWVEAALESGYPVREPIDFGGHSGKIALRMPRMLHKQAAELAELEGCSLNQLLVAAIARYVGGKGPVASRATSVNSLHITQLLITNVHSAHPLPVIDTLVAKKFVAPPSSSAWTVQRHGSAAPLHFESPTESAHG